MFVREVIKKEKDTFWPNVSTTYLLFDDEIK